VTSKPAASAAAHKGPPAFDPCIDRRRNVVERCFARLEQYRAIVTRYDKTAPSYQGMLDLTTLLIWL
jgi:transposase